MRRLQSSMAVFDSTPALSTIHLIFSGSTGRRGLDVRSDEML
jgi:hypothetical protein